MSIRLRQNLAFALGVAAFGGLCLALATVRARDDVAGHVVVYTVNTIGMLLFLGGCWALGEWRTRQLAVRAADPDPVLDLAPSGTRLSRWEWLVLLVVQIVVFQLRELPSWWMTPGHAYASGFAGHPQFFGQVPAAMILLTLLVGLRLPQLSLSQGRVWSFALLVVGLWWRFPTDSLGLAIGESASFPNMEDQGARLAAFWLLPVVMLGTRGGLLAIIGYVALVLLPTLPLHGRGDWRLATDYVPSMLIGGIWLLTIPWVGRAASRVRVLCEVGAGMLILTFLLQGSSQFHFGVLIGYLQWNLSQGGWSILWAAWLLAFLVLLLVMPLIKQNVAGPTAAMIVLILAWGTVNQIWALTLATLMIALTMSPLAWGCFFAATFFYELNPDSVKVTALFAGVAISLLPWLLGRWRIGRQSDVPRPPPRSLDVLIATRNEAANIEASIAFVRVAAKRAKEALGAAAPVCRILTIDGGSTDDTVARAEALGVEVLRASRLGRGNQFAEGLAATSGDLVLFLHADAQLDPDAITKLIRAFQKNPALAWGVLGLRYAGATRHLRWVAFQGWLRWVFTGLAFGDQGQFVRRDLLQGPDAVDAYPAQPLLEDVELSLRLQPLAARAWIGAPMLASPRAWPRGGFSGTTLRNLRYVLYYLVWRRLGDPPAELAEKVYESYYPTPVVPPSYKGLRPPVPLPRFGEASARKSPK